mgnify:FL=1
MDYEITELIYYPVKSLRGISVSDMEFDDFGPRWDRRFMLVNNDGRFITQRRYPKLSFLQAAIGTNDLSISGAVLGEVKFDLQSFVDSLQVVVWNDCVDAMVSVDKISSERLSAYIGEAVRMVYMPDESFRQLDRDFFNADKRVGFADAFPILLTNERSLDELNGRLAAPDVVTMNRFRPNIVFSGDQAYEEDGWTELQVGSLTCVRVKPCSRCSMTTINERGETGKEPLKTLAKYRRNEFGVCFGQNLVHLSAGSVRVGDRLKVLS